jgi:hypothetical protein
MHGQLNKASQTSLQANCESSSINFRELSAKRSMTSHEIESNVAELTIGHD